MHGNIFIAVIVPRFGWLVLAKASKGYICTPHEKKSGSLVGIWANSENILNIYFVTATFSNESALYFPNRANHYILASYSNIDDVSELISKQNLDRSSFMFNLSEALFEREATNIKYISMYFTKCFYEDPEIADVANIIAKRERVKKLSLAHFQYLTTAQPKFTFPYSRNVVVLEVEGEKTHQSDQKYCERTRREVARKGIPLTNFISLSILDKLK
ncbi:MAG: hypothetical protein WAM14_08925 [Candidatus Nitrosopolaris sp.]